MDHFEFRDAVNELFQEYEIKGNYITIKDDDDLYLFVAYTYFVLNDTETGLKYDHSLYISKTYSNDDIGYEQLFDELVMFKELILPKYL